MKRFVGTTEADDRPPFDFAQGLEAPERLTADRRKLIAINPVSCVYPPSLRRAVYFEPCALNLAPAFVCLDFWIAV